MGSSGDASSLRATHQENRPKAVVMRFNEEVIEGVEIFRPGNDRYRKVLDFNTYCLANEYQFCFERVAKHVLKWANRLPKQMKALQYEPMDPLLVIGFLSGFKMVHDSNGIHDGAAM